MNVAYLVSGQSHQVNLISGNVICSRCQGPCFFKCPDRVLYQKNVCQKNGVYLYTPIKIWGLPNISRQSHISKCGYSLENSSNHDIDAIQYYYR